MEVPLGQFWLNQNTFQKYLETMNDFRPYMKHGKKLKQQKLFEKVYSSTFNVFHYPYGIYVN